jgi:PIN domain nuclease of toxin-antitoxin system
MRSLDSSALVALLQRDSGADFVATRIRGALLSTVNYAEVVGLLTRRGTAPDKAREAILVFPLTLVDLDATVAHRAGSLEPLTRQEGLSLGDRVCLALAEQHGIPALTVDRAWGPVGKRLGIEVELIR